MPDRAFAERHLDPADHELAPLGQPMQVVPNSRARVSSGVEGPRGLLRGLPCVAVFIVFRAHRSSLLLGYPQDHDRGEPPRESSRAAMLGRAPSLERVAWRHGMDLSGISIF